MMHAAGWQAHSAVGSAPEPGVRALLRGQSNMLGEGKIAGTQNTSLTSLVQAGEYPYLWDATTKNWTTSKNIRNVFVMGSGGPGKTTVATNNFMNGGAGHRGSIGPELGIGGMLEKKDPTTPVMLLKSCIGNRALGWDLLPPTQKSFDWTDPKNSSLVWTYAGYHQSPNRWPKGTTPKPIAWVAGIQYDGDTSRADGVLKDLSTYYPGATDYEVAGFFWWQGDRDSRDLALTEHYESNLVALIKALRLRYKAPNAPFVAASLGESTALSPLPLISSYKSEKSLCGTGQSTSDPTCVGNCGGGILKAEENIADATKYPEFKGNYAFVDSHKFTQPGGSSGGHYGHNAKTYMDVGQAMGEAMVGLMK